jgi:hypothetical protein
MQDENAIINLGQAPMRPNCVPFVKNLWIVINLPLKVAAIQSDLSCIFFDQRG